MALEKQLSLDQFGGLIVNNAYIRISEIKFNLPDNDYVDVTVLYYANQELREQGITFDRKIISIPLTDFKDTYVTTDRIYQQAYTKLKTFPEFSGALDV